MSTTETGSTYRVLPTWTGYVVANEAGELVCRLHAQEHGFALDEARQLGYEV